MSKRRGGEIGFIAHRVELGVGLNVLGKLDYLYYQRECPRIHPVMCWAANGALPVSPASPENAIRVCLLRCLVLSSDAFRTVAPRMAAFEAAIKVKSLPVMPRRTSLGTL